MRWIAFIATLLVLGFSLALFVGATGVVVYPTPFIDVRTFGAMPDDGKDDTIALNAAWAACKEGYTFYCPPGVYDISAPLDWTSDYRVDVDASAAKLYARFPAGTTGAAVTWGGKSSRVIFGRFDGPSIYHLCPDSDRWNDDLAALCIRTVSKADVHWGVAKGFKIGLLLRAEGPAGTVSYSRFRDGILEMCQRSIATSADDKGWFSVLTFDGLKVGISTMPPPNDTASVIYIPKVPRGAPGGFRFVDCAFEGVGKGVIFLEADDLTFSSFDGCWTEFGAEKASVKVTPSTRGLLRVVFRGGCPFGVDWDNRILMEP